jgi:hypothetical protein
MQHPHDPDEPEELDNLLYDQQIALNRVRELMQGFASVCEVEKQLLQDEVDRSAITAKQEETS